MIDKGHTMMNSEDFDDEYEPFYDFSGTYEENFVGKILEDFDLTEEVVARPHESLHQAKPTEEIWEAPKEDDDWEDIDAEDANPEASHSQSDFTLVSNDNQAHHKPESSSDFTLISHHKP